jgi:hypothetical protein
MTENKLGSRLKKIDKNSENNNVRSRLLSTIQHLKSEFDSKNIVNEDLNSKVQEEIELINNRAAQLSSEVNGKIKGLISDNGWYEDSETGKKYFVKFPEDPDQARCEFIAFSIYSRLGIKTPEANLVELNGKIGIATTEILESESLTPFELRNSRDILDGFVADIFLDNTSLMDPLFCDVVKNSGGVYRTNSEASLLFNFDGTKKRFDRKLRSDLIFQLREDYGYFDTFKYISEREIISQIKILKEVLTDSIIEEILKDSGIHGDNLEILRKNLIQRRDALYTDNLIDYENYEEGENYPKQKSFLEVLENVSSLEFSERGDIYKTEELICDGNHIENQAIYFLKDKENNIILNFKLVSPENAIKKLLELKDASLDIKNTGTKVELKFKSGIVLSLSLKEKGVWKGQVQIVIPKFLKNKEAIDQEVSKIMSTYLKVDDALNPPTLDQERKYAETRYRWFYNIPHSEELTESQKIEIKNLRRRVVCEGYSTYVITGRQHELESRFGKFAFVHETSGDILKIIDGGLVSMEQLELRDPDFVESSDGNGTDYFEVRGSGGGSSVFTRCVNRFNLENLGTDIDVTTGATYSIVLLPRIINRLDWYSYPGLFHGNTNPEYFESRRLVDTQIYSFSWIRNESMYRFGISTSDFACVLLNYQNEIKDLKKPLGKIYQEIERYLLANIKNFDSKFFEKVLNRGSYFDILEYLENLKLPKNLKNNLIALHPRIKILKHYFDSGVERINGIPVHKFFIATVSYWEDSKTHFNSIINSAHGVYSDFQD